MTKAPLGLTKPSPVKAAADKRAGKKASLLAQVKALERLLNAEYRTGGDAVIALHDTFRAFRTAALNAPG